MASRCDSLDYSDGGRLMEFFKYYSRRKTTTMHRARAGVYRVHQRKRINTRSSTKCEQKKKAKEKSSI